MKASEHAPRLDVHRMHAAATLREVETGSIVAESRDHTRRPHEGNVVPETQSTGPARKLGDDFQSVVAGEAELAVAAIGDPQLLTA